MNRDVRRTGSFFFLPEKEMSLKVVFDNLRNYAIVGGIVALANLLNNGKLMLAALLYGKSYFPNAKGVVWAILGFAIILFGANALQSVHIILRILIRDTETGYEDDVPFVPRHQSLAERIWGYVCWAGVIALMLAFGLILMMFAMYLVFFAATGGR
jgi:hypothetical protein